MKRLYVFVASLVLLCIVAEISAGLARKMCIKKLDQVLMFICKGCGRYFEATQMNKL